MLSGNNGLLIKAEQAKTDIDIAQEKEIIALSYNSAVTKKTGNLDTTAVTTSDLNAELTNQGATASGSNPIIVTFTNSNRQYTISKSGIITYTGISSSTTELTDLEKLNIFFHKENSYYFDNNWLIHYNNIEPILDATTSIMNVGLRDTNSNFEGNGENGVFCADSYLYLIYNNNFYVAQWISTSYEDEDRELNVVSTTLYDLINSWWYGFTDDYDFINVTDSGSGYCNIELNSKNYSITYNTTTYEIIEIVEI